MKRLFIYLWIILMFMFAGSDMRSAIDHTYKSCLGLPIWGRFILFLINGLRGFYVLEGLDD